VLVEASVKVDGSGNPVKIGPFRSPDDYLLISKIGGSRQYPDLMRLFPNDPIPEGWEKLEKLNGVPVYKPYGLLCEEFMALKRYRSDMQEKPESCNKSSESEISLSETDKEAKASEKEILVLDIETTGFLNQGGSIIEIGAVSLDLETGEIKDVYDSLCREDMLDEKHKSGKFGWIFDNSDLKFEDVLSARAFMEVKKDFQEVINKYAVGSTAFNNVFDFGFLEDRGIEFAKKLACPMKLATPICKLPSRNGRSGYKWPNVEEAYSFFFPDRKYTELHRGLDDARHEAEIVFELYKRGVFKV
jgi:DNA polymerase-3 subunit epsilon